MIIGIGLSTTNNLATVWQNGQSELTPNALGKFLAPSVVCVDEDGMVLIGGAARDPQLIKPQDYVSDFKRMIDTSKMLRLGGREFHAEGLPSLISRQLKKDAENYLNKEVTEAVISVPAYFDDMQRRATKAAVTMTGSNVERLINEPTAVTLAYGLHNKDDEHQFLVFDLGSDTFDVLILELSDDIMEVHASTGGNSLGGEDVIDILIDAHCSR